MLSPSLARARAPQISDWEMYVHETARLILGEQTPQRLLDVRNRFYELLTHLIPPELILNTLTAELIKNLDQARASATAGQAGLAPQLTRGARGGTPRR